MVVVIGFEVVGAKGNSSIIILHSFLFHFNAGFVFCPFCLVLFLLSFPFCFMEHRSLFCLKKNALQLLGLCGYCHLSKK